MQDQEVKICEHCGARIKEYWQTLTNGLVLTLIKFARAVKRKDENRVHIIKEAGFNVTQVCNFQKLKYFGLVAKYDDPDNKAGYWVLTRLGLAFLTGEKSVCKKIKTYRGRIVEHSPYFVLISDFPEEAKFWDKGDEFEIHDGVPTTPTPKPVQLSL